VVAFVAGVLAMLTGGQILAPLGLRFTLVSAEALLALPGLVLLALAGRPLPTALGLVRVSSRVAILSAVAGATLWGASLGLMNVQFVVWRPPDAFLDQFRLLHEALKPHGLVDGLLSIAAIGVMPALCEETLFRGIVLPSLARMGAAVGLLGSAVLFAIIHVDAGPAFYRLPFAFAVGLGLGALRLATGSLVPSMLAHAVLNTITFLTVLLTGAAEQAVDEPQALSGALFLLAGAGLSALVFRALRR
jgi:hypothetical protein